jgi:chromosome partitioning protein
VILLLNEKGGVGKTTLSTNYAAYLAASGMRVLLVDGDTQGHSGLSLRVKREDGLAQLLLKDAPFDQVLRRVAPDVYGGDDKTYLLVLPSADATTSVIKAIGEKKINQFQLHTRLQEMNGFVDYVIIDASPTISELHTAFYLAADVAFCPTQCEYLSIEGLKRSVKHLQMARDAAAERGVNVARFAGIIPNMFNGHELVQYQNLGWMQGSFGNDLVLEPIRLRTAWKQAMQKRTPIFKFAPRTDAAKEAQVFFEQVMERAQ